MKLKYLVDLENDSITLERFLKYKLNLSTKLLRKLKSNERIFCNGKVHKIFLQIFCGDIIEIDMDFEEETEFLEPQNIPLEILYENEGFIAINKNPGIVVHPSANHYNGTIANALIYYFKQNNLNIKIRPVSRLDRDTSGVILFAKNAMIQDALIKQMKNRDFKKEYIGMVEGHIIHKNGTISLPIKRKDGSTIEREVASDGIHAVTHYKVLKKFNSSTLVKFELETGRTHQIRVHCLGINHPLIGDTLYSPNICPLIDRQSLHARRISFFDPVFGNKITITAPTPADIKYLIANS
jgi:23S rRNA pseudouridine1911/1915/1917 synthase